MRAPFWHVRHSGAVLEQESKCHTKVPWHKLVKHCAASRHNVCVWQKPSRLLLLRSFSGRCTTTDQVHLPRNILPRRSSVTHRDMPQLFCHCPQSRNTLSVDIGLGLAAFLHHNCVGATIAKLLRHRSSVRSAFHRSRALLYLNFVQVFIKWQQLDDFWWNTVLGQSFCFFL